LAEELVTDHIKVVGLEDTALEQLAIRRTAVAWLIGAHVEVRINVYRQHIAGCAECVGQPGDVGVADVVASAYTINRLPCG